MSDVKGIRLSRGRLELLERLLREEGFDRAPRRTVPRRTDPDAPIPLTFPQRRVWFLDRLAGHSSAYVISAALRVRGPFDPDTFTRACHEVVRRHESLRTVFFERDGEPYQRVLPDLAPQVRVVDLRGRWSGRAEDEVARREAELVARPFDLANGPLLRVELLRLADDDTALLLTMHHLVGDRWSMGVLMRELTALYGALAAGVPHGLPDLPIQYGDFAAWQQNADVAATWDEEVGYWTRRLADAPVDAGLAAGRPRPRQKTYQGSSVPIRLAPELVARLRDLAGQEGATLFMVLATAVNVLVHRLGGGDDVVLGTPVAGRTSVELEPLIGLFVNTLALRTDLTGDPTFRELLRRVATVCVEAYDHQSVPFDRLVEALPLERSPALTPVFQVLLSYQNVPFPSWEYGPVTIEPIPLEAPKAEFDLLFDLFEDGDARAGGTIWGRLEFSTDLFTTADAQRIAAALLRILDAAGGDPDRRIGDLPLADPAECALHGPEPAAPDATAHELVARQAARTPDAVAVRGTPPLRYGELDRRAGDLARHLREAGVGPGTRVRVAADRDPEVCLLAVLKAGAVHVTGDAATPVHAVLTGPEPADLTLLAPAAEPDQGDDARVGGESTGHQEGAAVPDRTRGPAAPGEAPDPARGSGLAARPGDATGEAPDQGDDLAFVAGESAYGHREPAAVLDWMRGEYRLTSADRIAALAPRGTEAALWATLLALTTGASLAPTPDGADDRDLVGLVRRERITTLFVPSPRLPALLDAGLERCPALKRVVCVGPPVTPEARDRFVTRSRARLHGLYGTWAAWTCPRERGTGRVPLGVPIPGAAVYVLDDRLRPVPPGLTGHLHVRLRHRPPTPRADHCVPSPYEPGTWLLPTGDLARVREDGVLDHLGRADRRVRPRGFHGHLDDVEAALRRHDRVRDAHVTARERGLVAYVAGDPAPDARELAAYLREHLPDYLLPAAFVPLAAVPRTPDGAVDASALPPAEFAAADAEDASTAPRDDVEREIAAIWRELLGVDRVGVHDDFFRLGGHSLLAIRLAARVAETFGVPYPLRRLFDDPTVAGIAAGIAEARSAAAADPDAIPVVDRGGPLPLSFAQERLIEHHPVPAEDPYHNVPTALELVGALDQAALRRALDGLVRRHEALRTRFVPGQDGRRQVVYLGGSWPLDVLDLRDTPEAEKAEQVRRVVDAEGGRSFRIDAEPPVRGTLVLTGPDRAVLVLVLHHLVTDNWSYGVLVRDLCELYTAETLGRPPALPALPVGFPDVVAWQRRRIADGDAERETSYWRRRLAGLPAVPALAVPESAEPGTDAAADDALGTGHAHGFTIGADVSAAVHDLAARHRATPFMVLAAAYAVLLAEATGSPEVPVAFPDAGRESPETANLVGYLVNDLLLRVGLGDAPPFAELLGRVRAATLDAYDHRGVPLWPIAGEDPFRFRFNLLNAHIPEIELPGLRAAPLSRAGAYVFAEVTGDIRPGEAELALIMREDGPALRGMWLWHPDRVPPPVAAHLIRRWPALLAALVTDPDRPVPAPDRRRS